MYIWHLNDDGDGLEGGDFIAAASAQYSDLASSACYSLMPTRTRSVSITKSLNGGEAEETTYASLANNLRAPCHIAASQRRMAKEDKYGLYSLFILINSQYLA